MIKNTIKHIVHFIWTLLKNIIKKTDYIFRFFNIMIGQNRTIIILKENNIVVNIINSK